MSGQSCSSLRDIASARYGSTQAIIRRASRSRFNGGIFVSYRAASPMGSAMGDLRKLTVLQIARYWRSCKLRDVEFVPVICPTCQIIFAGKASMPAPPFLFKGFLSLHGVVFDILVCRDVARGLPAIV
jgi:hypothetical protein